MMVSSAEHRSQVRNLLGWLPFSIKHVLFSAALVSETEARLPEKVNLYSYAYFPLSRSFEPIPTKEETNALAMDLDAIVGSPFSGFVPLDLSARIEWFEN